MRDAHQSFVINLLSGLLLVLSLTMGRSNYKRGLNAPINKSRFDKSVALFDLTGLRRLFRLAKQPPKNVNRENKD